MVAAIGLATAAVGAYGASQSGKGGSTTSSNQQQLDPRMQAILYGDGSSGSGLLGQVAGLAGQPRAAGLGTFGGAADNYLAQYGASNLANSQTAANHLTNQISTPFASVTSNAEAVASPSAQIKAPSQNSLDLKGAYDRFINGNAGANPYLTKALQAGVDQTNASFAKNQGTLTDTLQRSVLPSIRSAAVAAGGYGGSRQGIAEGNAIGDFTRQLNDSNTALGLANSANTTGAQAQSYNQGQDRSLSATQQLGGQQYQTALTQAQMDNQMASQNSAQAQQTNSQNAGMYQQTNLANQQAQLASNQLNSANTATGVGLQSGLLGSAYNYGTANDAYDRTKLGQIAGTVGQFTGYGGSSSNTQPYFTNPFGSAVGGATAGLGLYNAYKNAGGGSSSNFLNNNAGLLQNNSAGDLYSLFGARG